MLASTQTNADGTPKHGAAARRSPSIAPSTGANQINRRDLNREVELSANVVGRSAGEVTADI